MTRYTLDGEGVLQQLAELPDASQIFDDLAELEIDPMNSRGDMQSSIQPYKDSRYGFVFSKVVGDGHLVVYRVLQDYPRVILKHVVVNGGPTMIVAD